MNPDRPYRLAGRRTQTARSSAESGRGRKWLGPTGLCQTRKTVAIHGHFAANIVPWDGNRLTVGPSARDRKSPARRRWSPRCAPANLTGICKGWKSRCIRPGLLSAAHQRKSLCRMDSDRQCSVIKHVRKRYSTTNGIRMPLFVSMASSI